MSSTGFQTDKAGQAAGNAVLLSPNDNVVVACSFIRAGKTVRFDGHSIIAVEDVETGHKIACKLIDRDGPVIKYDVPIGFATMEVAIGEHVHLHNMRSDYIASFTRSTVTGA